MKKILLFSASVVAASMMWAQNRNVTFQVDMSKVTVSPNGVHIAGTVQAPGAATGNWDPATTPLTDANSDGVYEVTLPMPDGTYQYKFVNGNAWGSDESVPGACAVSNNREIVVTQDATLPVVCFGSCTACPAGAPDTLTVTLNVNMKNFMKKYGSPFTVISVAGSFQKAAGIATKDTTWKNDWDPGKILLTDSNMDSLYTVSFKLPEGIYQYKFLAGSSWGTDELVPSGCASGGNREMTINGVANGTQSIAATCFGECADCGILGPQRAVTFMVDMAAEVYDTVVVSGSIKYPADTKTKMTRVGTSDVFSVSIPVYTGAEYGYKFFANTVGESVTGACGLNDFGKNRKLTLPVMAADTMLPIYVFGSCNTSVGIDDVATIGFRVFPNPFSSSARIEFNNSDRYTVEVLTLAGQIVERMDVANSYAEINRKQLSAGMYLISVSNAAGVRTTQKLVIE